MDAGREGEAKPTWTMNGQREVGGKPTQTTNGRREECGWVQAHAFTEQKGFGRTDGAIQHGQQKGGFSEEANQ